MVVLACYGLIIHLMSFVVLHVKYTFFKGKLLPVENSPPAQKTATSTTKVSTAKVSEPTATGSSQNFTPARPQVKIVPAASGKMDNEIEC